MSYLCKLKHGKRKAKKETCHLSKIIYMIIFLNKSLSWEIIVSVHEINNN